MFGNISIIPPVEYAQLKHTEHVPVLKGASTRIAGIRPDGSNVGPPDTHGQLCTPSSTHE